MLLLRGIILILFHWILNSESKELVARFKNIAYNYSFNPNFLFASVQHKYNQDDFIFNATVEYKVPFAQIKLYTSLAYQISDNDNEYRLESPTASIDLCKLGTRGVVQILFKNFLELFSTCIDGGLSRSCPTPLQTRIMTNCNVSNIKIPTMAPAKKFKLSLRLMAKPLKSRRIIEIGYCFILAQMYLKEV